MSDEVDRDMPIPEDVTSVRFMFPSKYLAKEDLRGKEVDMTISRVTRRKIRCKDGSKEVKWCVHFEEMDRRPEADRKVWAVGVTVCEQIAAIAGDGYPHNWPATRIRLWPDEAVMCYGKRVGGIRVKAPEPAKVRAAP